jgi:hypothetical protein
MRIGVEGRSDRKENANRSSDLVGGVWHRQRAMEDIYIYIPGVAISYISASSLFRTVYIHAVFFPIRLSILPGKCTHAR